jgi:hypothetical protein
MTKPEIRMNDEIRNPKKSRRARSSSFGLRILFGFLVSAFVIPAQAADPELIRGRKPQDVANVTVDPHTDQIIQGALKWLASKQSPSGAWSENQSPVAMTGYSLIAFLSCGQLPGEGEHSRTVSRGVQYLLECVGHDGYISSASAAAGKRSSNMYDHGIAAIALAEVYGQTKDPNVRAKLEKAVQLTISAQAKVGGWRYQPRPTDADISVTVLQVVALRAAKNSGLDIPQHTIDAAVKYVRSCVDPKTGGFCYQPNNKQAGFARTAAAIYSLQVCGEYDDPLIGPASEYLDKTKDTREWYTYGHFYAAPAKYMIGGETWKTWYAHMNKTLTAAVRRNGEMYSWEPIDKRVNDIYATAVYTMILAMPYHYIPLYQR